MTGCTRRQGPVPAASSLWWAGSECCYHCLGQEAKEQSIALDLGGWMDHLDLGSHKGNGSTLSQSIHDRRPSFRLGMGRRRTLSGGVVVTFDMTMTVTVRTQPLLPVKSTFVCCSCSCARPRPQVLLYSFLLVWMTVLFRATRLVVSSLPLPQLRCSPGLVSPLWLPQKKNRRQEEKLILLLRMTYSTENHMGDKGHE